MVRTLITMKTLIFLISCWCVLSDAHQTSSLSRFTYLTYLDPISSFATRGPKDFEQNAVKCNKWFRIFILAHWQWSKYVDKTSMVMPIHSENFVINMQQICPYGANIYPKFSQFIGSDIQTSSSQVDCYMPNFTSIDAMCHLCKARNQKLNTLVNATLAVYLWAIVLVKIQ